MVLRLSTYQSTGENRLLPQLLFYHVIVLERKAGRHPACVCVRICVFQGQRKGKPAYILLERVLKLPIVFLSSPRQCTKQVFEMKQCLHPAHCKPSQINHQNPSVQILCCKGWSRSSSREELEFSKEQVLWPNRGRRDLRRRKAEQRPQNEAETPLQSGDPATPLPTGRAISSPH